MDEKIIFEKDSTQIKNPRHLKRKVFILDSPRQLETEPTSFRKESI